ncbi:Testis-expressed protein 11 [Holothuria leucospilota]|uniref:Testis-expressed protein 11 n=1 Tax=Holothuria leucospilota TaxID=206669 RepID=A0A9Q1BJ69_HOLLE|nr:Testis-expressed protein 11 [Holothuria leucospilota]
MKIAWNLAIENSASSELTHMFFSLCAEFCSLIGQDVGSLSRQKTCLVMAAAACLQTARDKMDQQNKLALLEQVLQLVKTCRDIYHQISGSEAATNNSDRALVLLNLYEFEALAKLGRTAEIDLFAKQIVTDKISDVKTVETMAALAMEPPCQYKALSKKLLTVALEWHKMSAPIDVTRCSKVFHSLIQLCLGDGNCNDSEGRDEAWNYFNDALSIIQSAEHLDYPEMEILWLMTKAWNTGIYGYGTGKLDQTVKWCRLSMRLLNHLTSFKDNYQPKMQALFEEISAKMEDTDTLDVKKEP